MGFTLPIFAHPDQHLTAEVLTIWVALCSERSKINSQPQSIKPAVPLHDMELLLPLFFFAVVVSKLLGPLCGGDRSKDFSLYDEKKIKSKGQRQIIGTLTVYKEPGNMTLQYYVLDKTAVKPQTSGKSRA